MKIALFPVLALCALLALPACKTKAEIRREQEFEKIKEDLKEVRGNKTDIEVSTEELKSDIAKLSNAMEESAQGARRQVDEVRKEVTLLNTRMQTLEQRVQALEQRSSSDDSSAKQAASERARGSYEQGRRLFDDGKFEEAAETLRNVLKNKGRSEEAKKSQFLLADTYFASKDYASAALEYSEYRKTFPKDALVPNAIYRQAQSFRMMGKVKEARLFYQELIERFPRNSLSSSAKKEMKRLR